MDKANRIEARARALADKHLKKLINPLTLKAYGFDELADNIKNDLLILAKEQIEQEIAAEESKRDEAKEVEKSALFQHIATTLQGEKDYMLKVYRGCMEIPFELIKEYLNLEVMMFLYYSGTPVDKAIEMATTMHENIKDKMRMIKAQSEKKG